MDITLQPIGILHSPYREKFLVPRQPGLVRTLTAELRLLPPYNRTEAVRELESFSHLWLIFLFHQNLGAPWQPTVRPPRLGGNKRVGVFASRSPFRPNPIGLSAVRLNAVRHTDGGPVLDVSGIDLIDQTPILDIKPYLPYSDSIPDAQGGFARQAPEHIIPVHFTEAARRQLESLRDRHPNLEQQLRELLSLDPRPAYQRQQQGKKEYGALLFEFNIRWTMQNGTVLVLAIDAAADSPV